MEEGMQSESIDAPGKWRPRWTGPHEIIRQSSQTTYDFVDNTTARVYADIHVDTLYPFHPWSMDHPSTSPKIDRELPWHFGGHLRENTLVALPAPEGSFFIAKLLSLPLDDNEALNLQWLSNRIGRQTQSSSYMPGWIRHDDREYYGKRCNNDQPYTALTSETVVTREDVILHDFHLTTRCRLNVGTFQAIKRARKSWPEN